MASIWKQQKDVNEHPNRNNFDLSKKSNISMKFGTLYPVLCQPVVPGDSFSIDTAFNLKLMPVIFPVQTKMRAHMHYYFVRNKNIWSNWENWISNLVGQSEHPHPYLDIPDYKFANGSIHDFLGVPTSAVAHSLRANVPIITGSSSRPLLQFLYRRNVVYSDTPVSFGYLEEGNSFGWTFSSVAADENDVFPCLAFSFTKKLASNRLLVDSDFYNSWLSYLISASQVAYIFSSDAPVSVPPTFKEDDMLVGMDTSSPFNISEEYPDTGDPIYYIELSDALVSTINGLIDNNKIAKIVLSCTYAITDSISTTLYGNHVVGTVDNPSGFIGYDAMNADLYSNYLHINALPYRAYESIYYTYYNNNVLNPLKIGGVTQFNRYNTNLGDGADNTDYHLFQRNYELDFLTSSLPSPQQGVAPVVGMTALGDVTIEDENGITTAHAEIDNDGTISKVILTSPAASIDHARTAMNIAACGMSISDFRQTNALQRFLETNIRKGYRYMDFIAGHFGKEPEYRELDLPEFIGGFSRDISVSTVVSNADTLGDGSGKSLGAYGGYAQVVGGGNSSIRHYCDDYGFIIGILSVVPTPCYSQLLPKHMVAPDNFLDYYFPEFSSSGLQPITYKEVAPIQAYIDGLIDDSKSLEDTFGYQRPNYDLVSAVDEVHGEFRGSLRNYVINRIFDSRPELGQSFISINPSEINDVFVNTTPDDDCIIGEIGFAIHAKRPIPRVVIPNLGK